MEAPPRSLPKEGPGVLSVVSVGRAQMQGVPPPPSYRPHFPSIALSQHRSGWKPSFWFDFR
ncbi:hypothetical protein SKAU_G00311650 [Synaphobranchus kaupii]|uniref:Uncharacterized protein n=1 Tax=Synaphobranchus kaupii TaxID=118154 RepID=A0A9Q1ERR9_SYNKA|nr:hypothetical protein SKAU_G00311650 [Synaphobranchus kaupii]